MPKIEEWWPPIAKYLVLGISVFTIFFLSVYYYVNRSHFIDDTIVFIGDVISGNEEEFVSRLEILPDVPIAEQEPISYFLWVNNYKSQLAALDKFSQLQVRHPRILKNLSPRAEKFKLNGRWTRYKLLIGPLKSAAEASYFCLRLIDVGEPFNCKLSSIVTRL